MKNREKKTTVIKVPKDNAERIRKKLVYLEILDDDFKIDADQHYVYLPVNTTEPVDNYEISYKIMQQRKKQYTIEDYLESCIPAPLQSYIPSSIDFIGKDVALVKLHPLILEFKKEIGKAICKANNVKAVYLKTDDISGVFRTPQYELIAGDPIPYPQHREHGVIIQVDLHNAYFNPRLGNEHHRVAKLVQPEEKVLDMFTGVGPFPLHIAKQVKAQVFAVDINPAAIECLRKSITLQRLQGAIKPIVGDIRKVADKLPAMDRIIMNLPGSARDFLDLARKKLTSTGIIHFYQFIMAKNESEALERAQTVIDSYLPTSDFITKKLDKLRDISPHKFQICADISKKSEII